MLIGYARVSKTDGSQRLDLQRDALTAAGVASEAIYEDCISGKRDVRPGLEACLKAVRSGDTLVVCLSERVKSGHLWTPQIRPFRRPETGVEFYFTASCVCKVVWILVRQLRGPHFSTCA